MGISTGIHSPLTCDGGVAAGTLFGIEAAEALDAEWAFPLRGEGLASQRGFAASAEKTLLVPNLVLVGHPSFSQSLRGHRQTGYWCCVADFLQRMFNSTDVSVY